MIRDVHVGKVLANDDPSKAGGLQLQVDALEDGVALAGGEWIPPAFPFAGSNVGFFFLPDIGALVEVEVDADPEGSVEDLGARWRAVLYTDADAVPSEFLSDQTVRGGIKFGEGVLLFDKKQDLLSLISANTRLGTEDASHPVMRGDTYNDQLNSYLVAEDAENTLDFAYLTALNSALSTWAALTPPGGTVTNDKLTAFAGTVQAVLAPYLVGHPLFKAAIATFNGAKTTWLSTRVKTE